jgi:hypothetical protein
MVCSTLNGRGGRVDPINRSFNRAIKLSQPLRDSFNKDSLYNDPATLISYYKGLVDLALQQIISELEASFLIADTIWYKAVSYNYDIESVVILASGLDSCESPKVSRVAQKCWDNLVQMVTYQYLNYSEATKED